MDLEKLKEFLNFMDENNLSELEIEEEGKRIRLKKNTPLSEFSLIPSKNQSGSAPSAETKKEKSTEALIEIKAPMVGTFYRAPSPGAKPYTDINQEITEGDVVCIIEAMKLMNEIKSEVTGKIVKILVEDGEPVEYGQPLFQVKPL